MAVTVEYQSWDSATYSWLDNSTSTAAPQQINDKLTTWITAVNANASNANRQVTLVKSPASSTSAAFVGWTLKFDSNTSGSPFWVKLHTTTSVNIACYFGTTYTDDGSSGGYGLTGGTAVSDTSVLYASSATSGEFVVASETANGEEFFAISWRIGSDTAKSDCLLIFKDTNNEWAGVFTDGATVTAGTLYMTQHTTPARTMSVQFFVNYNASSTALAPFQLWTNGGLPAANNYYTAFVMPKSPSLYLAGSSTNYSFGRYATLADSSKVLCLANCPFWVRF